MQDWCHFLSNNVLINDHWHSTFFWWQYQTSHYNDVIMSAMASEITSPTIVYSSVDSGTDERKHQSFASLAIVRGIHRWPENSLHKGPVMWKMFPFDDIMWTVNHSPRLWCQHSVSREGCSLPEQQTAWSYKVCCHCREECFTAPSHWCVLYWTGTIKIILVEIVHLGLCTAFYVINILPCTYYSNMSLNKICQLKFNSLALGTCGSDFRSVISECILWIKFMSTSCEIALRWMPWSTFYDKSILIQVIAWCYQTINWSNVDPDLHRHMVSIGHNELVPFLINWSPIYLGPT